MKTNASGSIIRPLRRGLFCLFLLALPLAAQHTDRLTLEQSTDFKSWQTVPIAPAMLDANGKILVRNATPRRFYRMQMEMLIHPSVTTQPASVYIAVGQTTTLTVAASGTGPFTYQWHQGSLGTVSPVGTNSPSFTTPALVVTTSHWVRVSNAAGTADSTAATVTVTGNPAPVPAPDEFALIPAGNFLMGDFYVEGSSDERPLHNVHVSAFYMGKYEVTKERWDSARTWGVANGYTDLPSGEGKDTNHPVRMISWQEMVKWCNARSQQDGLTPCYSVGGAAYMTGNNNAVVCHWNASGYRLPTEAEWEKAARGGLIVQRSPWGNTITQAQANYRSLAFNYGNLSGPVGYHPLYRSDPRNFDSSPVGAGATNRYGLYNLAGNVGEFCWDWRLDLSNYYESSPSADPRGPASGLNRIVRGGNAGDEQYGCRVSSRVGRTPDSTRSNGVGFRIARRSVP